eukprot:362783-Chlamydomonas_euryale.AAC.6
MDRSRHYQVGGVKVGSCCCKSWGAGELQALSVAAHGGGLVWRIDVLLLRCKPAVGYWCSAVLKYACSVQSLRRCARAWLQGRLVHRCAKVWLRQAHVLVACIVACIVKSAWTAACTTGCIWATVAREVLAALNGIKFIGVGLGNT